jgi:hypothetical protein
VTKNGVAVALYRKAISSALHSRLVGFTSTTGFLDSGHEIVQRVGKRGADGACAIATGFSSIPEVHSPMIPFRSPLFSALDSISFGDRLRMQAGADIAPLIANWGSGTVDVGADSVTGSVLSVGPVALRDRAKVDGSVETAAKVTKSNGASVTGQSVEGATVQLPTAPTISVTWPTSSKYGFTVEAGTSASKVAGAYGNIVVRSSGTLNLAAGVYFMATLLMEADAKLVVEPGVVIHVREGLTIRGQFRYAAGAIAQVAILYRGTAAAIVEREFHGSILAPYAQLTLGANVPVVFAGQFLARQMVVRTDVTAIAETLADGGIFPTPILVPAIGTKSGIHLGSNSRILSWAGSDTGCFNWGNEPVVVGQGAITGPITSKGGVNVGASATVKGDILSGGEVVFGTGATSTGSVVSHGNPLFPMMPTLDVEWPAVNRGDWRLAGETQTGIPGAYGKVVLEPNAILVLPAGDYYVENLQFGAFAQIRPIGNVRIYVRTQLVVGGTFTDTTGSLVPVQLFYTGTQPVIVESDFYGQIVAPNAVLMAGSDDIGSKIAGQIFAANVVLKPNTTMSGKTWFALGLFDPAQVPPDKTTQTYARAAHLVVAPVATTVPVRVRVIGADTVGPIDVRRGGDLWVKPTGSGPWSIAIESLNQDGTWSAVATTQSPIASGGGVDLSSLSVASNSGVAAGVSVQVQQRTSDPLPKVHSLQGTIRWESGEAFSGIVTAYDKDLSGSQVLQSAITDASGKYVIDFLTEQYYASEHKRPDLYIVARMDIPSGRKECGRSEVVFNATSPTTIDLDLAGSPSILCEYERLDFLIQPLIGALKPSQLNLESHVDFLSNELSESRSRISLYILANKTSSDIAAQSSADEPSMLVPAMALYGLYREGMPTALELLCRKSKDELIGALSKAENPDFFIDLRKIGSDPNTVAVAIGEALDNQKTVHMVGLFERFIGGWEKKDKNWLNTLAQRYKANKENDSSKGDPAKFWDSCIDLFAGNDKPYTLANLKSFLALVQICGGNHSLANSLFQTGLTSDNDFDLSYLATLSLDRLSSMVSGSISQLKEHEKLAVARNLKRVIERAFTKEVLLFQLKSVGIQLGHVPALLEHNLWIDPREPLLDDRQLDLTGIPEGELANVKISLEGLRAHLTLFPVPVAGTSPEEKRQKLVALLRGWKPSNQNQGKFASPLVDALVELFESATDFQFGKKKIDQFLRDNASFFDGKAAELVDETKLWVRAMARLFAIVPSYEIATRLKEMGYRSASQIARTSRAKFLTDFGFQAFGDGVANTIHRTARKIAISSAQLHGLLHSSKNALPVFGLGSNGAIEHEPSWSDLFGRPSSVRVPEWKSVASPAAYFVELLRYLESLSAPSGTAQPYSALIQRRPDLVQVALDKESTFEEISHSQLVLEILQAYVVNYSTWSTAKWNSLGWTTIQKLSDTILRGDDADVGDSRRSGAIYPLDLPVDAQLNDQDLLLRSLGLRLCDLGTNLKVANDDAQRNLLARVTLGLASNQFDILVGDQTITASLGQLWGCSDLELTKMRSEAVRFLGKAEISFIELKQYAASSFSKGKIEFDHLDKLDLNAITFKTSLDDATLMRANRFFRLLKQMRRFDVSCSIYNLDAALQAFGNGEIDAASLQKLASVVRISRRLSIDWFDTITLFAKLPTRKPIVFGDDGTMIELSSPYQRLFRLDESTSDPDFAIDGNGELLRTDLTIASKSRSIQGALGISAAELSAILDSIGLKAAATNSFSVGNLSRIHGRHLLGKLLGTDTDILAIIADLSDSNGRGRLEQVDVFESFLDDWGAFSSLSLPASTLRFLCRNSVVGTDHVVALFAKRKAIHDELSKSLAEVDASLKDLIGDDLENIRVSKKREVIGKILGDALSSDEATILDLVEGRLTISHENHPKEVDGKIVEQIKSTDPAIYCLFDLELFSPKPGSGSPTDANGRVENFGAFLTRLQKVALVVSSLKLAPTELDEMAKAKANHRKGWNDFDLDDFDSSLAGSETVSLVAKIGAACKYAIVRDQIPAPDQDAVSSLCSIWSKAFTSSDLSTVTGWNTQDIDNLVSLQYGATPTVPATNSIAYTLQSGIAIARRLGQPVQKLALWVGQTDGDPALTHDLEEALRQKFDPSNWASAKSKFLVDSRNFRRESLVRLVLHLPGLPADVKTPDRLYQWFLIDVSMDAGQITSRIVQGIATIQQFVQRCLLELEHEVETQYVRFPGVSRAAFDPKRWNWMKNYRVWEANRRVFLFPENYIESDLRPDKTAFFRELESSLNEADVTTENVEKTFQSYLQKLDSVARLKTVAHCTDPETKLLHVIGRTEDIPGTHYHRTCDKHGVWTGWEALPVEIPSEQLVPVFNNRRLYLYWLEFGEKADNPTDAEVSATQGNGTHSAKKPKKFWEISLAWIEFQYGKWSSKKMTTPETGSADNPVQGSTLLMDDANRHPSDYRMIVDLPEFIGYGSGGVGTLEVPLRVVQASHIEKKVARARVVVEQVTESYKNILGLTRHRLVNVSKTVMEDCPTGVFYSMLSEAGSWSVLRPGGRMVPLDPRKDKPLQILTELDWVNDGQFWKMEDKLRFLTPVGWKSDSKEVSGSVTLEVLGKIDVGYVLFEASNKDIFFQPPWKPYFFLDNHKSYLVTAKSETDCRKFSSSPTVDVVAQNLSNPDQVDPDVAMQNLQSLPEMKSLGEYFSVQYSGSFAQQVKTCKMHFAPHYHPYTAELLALMVNKGVDGVLSLDPQTNLNDGSGGTFNAFGPNMEVVSTDVPRENIDFSLDGSYSIYNWEIFFHIPMLIACRFMREKRFEEARRWFHFIFDPTTDAVDGAKGPQRFWRFAPLQMEAESARVGDLLKLFNSSESILSIAEKAQKRKAEDQLSYSAENPFEPHGIARLRLGAYQKTVFMKYLENLVEWADQLFMSDSRESINEATQLYVLAKDLLGPAPERIPMEPSTHPAPTYATLREGMDGSGDALAAVEDWFTDNNMGTTEQDSTDLGDSDSAAIAGPGASDYFVVPDNEQLAEFWNVLDDRLYKIRHGLDINGNARPLSLFSPRLDPANLVAGAASGTLPGGNDSPLSAPIPLYRFSALLPKALEFCNEVKSFGASLLSALEKKDAETLGLKRSQYEIALLQMTRKIREEQIKDAENALSVLKKSRQNANERQTYYRGLKILPQETAQIKYLNLSAGLQAAAGAMQTFGGAAHAFPTVEVGCSGFGGTPHVTLKTGGESAGNAAQSIGTGLTTAASLLSHAANCMSIFASWEHRQEEWTFQADSAKREMEQIDLQIEGAESRIRIAKAELASQELQVRNAQAVETFLKTKFTNDQLYSWMAGQLSSLYFRVYQLAFQLAKQVEACYQFERREKPSVGISFGSWDGLRKGLLAGESLALDLRRMELEYMKNNVRDSEITKSVSLVSLNPAALISLKENGLCTFSLPEALFDLDHPGYYYRRIKSIAITVPCVTGPYTGINAKLTLQSNTIRKEPNFSDPGIATPDNRAFGPVALSIAQNDTGMFETNLRDERFLPFEGCGVADSKWELAIPKACNSFDLDTISDVVMKIQYTAVWGGSTSFEAEALKNAALPLVDYSTVVDPKASSPKTPSQTNLVKHFSLRHEFADAWHAWIQKPISGQKLKIRLTPERFPLGYRGRKLTLTEIGVLVDVPVADENAWNGSGLAVNPDSTTPTPSPTPFGFLKGFGKHPFAGVKVGLEVTTSPELEITINAQTLVKIDPTLKDLILLVRYEAT